jgi:uncharacterized protein DUF4388/tetratricopeptide repeat protein
MAIEGPLKELGIHDVFQLLDLSRKTGALRVTSDLRHNAGVIHFQDGAVVYAEIRSNPHPLGGLLLRTGRITEGDLERARDMQQRGGDPRRLGEILVGIGAITARELERQLRFQIEEVVFEVMSWNEGFFSFTEGAQAAAPPEDATVRIPVEALLMEGARRIDEWSRIEDRIPHLGVVPTLAPTPVVAEGAGASSSAGELDLLPPEWEVLALIDGVRDIRALGKELGRSEFDIAKTVFGLESAGVIMLVEPRAAGAGAEGGGGGTGASGRRRPGQGAVGEVEALIAHAEDALRAKDFEAARALASQAANLQPHDPTVHLLLGRIHVASGRPPAAVEELRRALRVDPLCAPAHRLLGFALTGVGRFREAIESWAQWERLAARAEGEEAHLEEVRCAREAAQVLAGSGTHG